MRKFKLKFGWMLTEDGYLINLTKGDAIYKLNKVGKEILALISEGKTGKEICTIISEKYNVSSDTILKDFEAFITKLADLGAIEVIENEK